MHQNNGKLQAGRGPLPRTLGVLIASVMFVVSAIAQDPNALFASSLIVKVDPQKLNLGALDGINPASPVFANPVSFTVNLWTDNTLTMSGDVVTMHMDFSQQDARSISRTDGVALNVGFKATTPGGEVSGGMTSNGGVTTVRSDTFEAGWKVSDEIRFKLEGNKVSVVITSTVNGMTTTKEIALGTLDSRNLFKPFERNDHLDGFDWWVAQVEDLLPGNVSSNAPSSINPLLDYTAFGKRGFFDPYASQSEWGWKVTGYRLWRVYSGDKVLRYWVEAEYEYTVVKISLTILQKPVFMNFTIE